MFAEALLVVLVTYRSVSSANSAMLKLVCADMWFIHIIKVGSKVGALRNPCENSSRG